MGMRMKYVVVGFQEDFFDELLIDFFCEEIPFWFLGKVSERVD